MLNWFWSTECLPHCLATLSGLLSISCYNTVQFGFCHTKSPCSYCSGHGYVQSLVMWFSDHMYGPDVVYRLVYESNRSLVSPVLTIDVPVFIHFRYTSQAVGPYNYKCVVFS